MWTPLWINENTRQNRGGFFLYVVGRLADGATMDGAQAEMDGIAATREIMRVLPDARVVMLSAHEDQEIVARAVEAGAAGRVSVEFVPAGLVTGLILSIGAVVGAFVLWPRSLAGARANSIRRPSAQPS